MCFQDNRGFQNQFNGTTIIIHPSSPSSIIHPGSIQGPSSPLSLHRFIQPSVDLHCLPRSKANTSLFKLQMGGTALLTAAWQDLGRWDECEASWPHMHPEWDGGFKINKSIPNKKGWCQAFLGTTRKGTNTEVTSYVVWAFLLGIQMVKDKAEYVEELT